MDMAPAIFAFGFGNLAMLGWLAAAAAPLIIHLLNRRKYREMSWAAMEFLLAAIRKQSRRVRIEQWILLAVRTSLIVCLVLAVAEPYLERAGLTAASGARTHKLLVIDGSFSMGYKPTDKTRFDRAKELASQIVDESSEGDGFTLVLMSDPPRTIVGTPAFEAGRFVEEVERLELPHGGGNLPATLEEVERILNAARREQPKLTQRQVFFLTDLGRNSWSPDLQGVEALAQFRERVNALADTASLVVIDLGQEGSENLAVTDFRTEAAYATTAREVSFKAEVRNFGRQTRSQQIAELYVDGRRAGEDVVNLDPGGSNTVAFSYRFDTPGDHAVEVRLGADLLDIDNRRWLSLPVKESIRVLCVNGKPQDADLHGATDYLKLALAPATDTPGKSVVQPDVVTESALLDLDLTRYDCIFLCNVGQFTGREAKVLSAYLKQGGGLVFFLGDRVLPERYNQELTGEAAGAERLLPARLEGLVNENQYLFDPLDYKHPLLRAFRGQSGAGLVAGFPYVQSFYRLKSPENSRAQVVLAFEGGDPLIIEEPLLGGRSILIATSADTSWTTLPISPSYLPLVQEILSWAVGRQINDRNLQVGQALGSTIRNSAAKVAVHVQPPSGPVRDVPLVVEGAQSRWTDPETWQSGVYMAEIGAPAPQSLAYAVNVDTSESDLTRLDPIDLPQGLIHRTNWQDLDEQPSAEISDQGGLHVGLLYLALALLFLETFLAWFFGQQRS